VAKDKDNEPNLLPASTSKATNTKRRPCASAYKIVMHYARMSASKPLGRRVGSLLIRARPHFQQCAVRVTYSKNTTTGQWRAHGRYIARETVTHESPTKQSDSTAPKTQFASMPAFKSGRTPRMNAFGNSSYRLNSATEPISSAWLAI
jgi:hypothetical protein